MTTGRTRPVRRGAAAIAGAAALISLAACTPVAGSGSAQPTDVAAYQSTVASSRAAAAAAAKTSACTAWRAAFDKRNPLTDATIAATKDGKWTWDSIGPAINAELAAIATESGTLPGIVATPDLAPTIRTLMTDYKTKLDAYGEGLRADQAARSTSTDSWSRSNPALDALQTVTNNVQGICSIG
ncbi:hypothetical protein FK268_13895 [Tsukamurella sputi]|uniref:Lipoprotein n=1 Tax=Tsukamurella sputi TaxID=2591848 RepID=A0A5C5RK23_9ACTN|nr:hypothetical protein [Tsukamurella sputi]TWS23379.1 hypothetical protein FK268_13895 [Tsukamurella sputi]